MSEPGNDTMRREIESQPRYVADALWSLRDSARLAVRRGLGDRTGTPRVWAGGCGDSYFAALALSELFRMSETDYAPVTAQDVARYPRVSSNDVVVLISISGSTLRTVEAARTARERSAQVVAITCNPDSALGQASDAVIELPYEPISRSTPHTLDYTMSLLALLAFGEALSGLTIDRLEALSDLIQAALGPADQASRVVAGKAFDSDAIGDARDEAGVRLPRTFFLGAGPHRGTALYGAAKFYEAGGLPAFANETENFVHGMNFLVEPGDVGCVIAPDARDWERANRLVRGLGELGAFTLAVGFESDAADAYIGGHAMDPTSRETVARTGVDHALLPFLEVLPVQLLCWHAARVLDLDVERPRAGRRRADVHAQVQKAWMSR